MKKIWNFVDKLENTRRVFLIFAGFIGVTLLILQTDDAETLGFIKISKEWVFNFDLVLIIIFILVFLLESFYILTIGFKDRLSESLAKILLLINKTSTLLFKILFVWPLSLLLKPVILNVIEKQKPMTGKGINFFFTNNSLGHRSDDQYFNRVVKVESLTIYIKPLGENRYWRFGVKFSKDKNFPTSRFDENHILFHLTKDTHKNELEWNLYEPKNNQRQTLLMNYSNQSCWIVIKTTGQYTTIQVLDENRYELETVRVHAQKFAQIFAWADGQSSYNINALIDES